MNNNGKNEKDLTIKERLTRIEKYLFNEIRHELKWHRILLLIILAAIITAGIANLFGG